MIFHSLVFLVFFAIVFAGCRLLPHRPQNWFLILAGWIFYGWVDAWWVGLLLFTAFVDYYMGRLVDERPDKKKLWLLCSVISNFGVLATFKYFDFFSASFASAMGSLGWKVNPFLLHWVLPAGLSFYTFQSVSYVIDIYRGELKARKNLGDYLLFASFFPQLVAGPIERAHNLLTQVEKPRVFDARIARPALVLIAWGFLKKLVIADNVAPSVNRIFALDDPSFPLLWAGVLGFGVQIYADFSAYTDIARGCARLLGFELARNFNHPYLADSPSDFWRRWHMSLSTWFRDYVFIPLGGSRQGLARTIRNVLITFFLSGLWHGAAWNYVLWGLWHGLLLVIWVLWERAPEGLRPGRLPKVLRVALVFVLMHIGWLMFREQSISHLLGHFSANPFAAAGMEWRLGVFYAAQFVLFSLPLWIHPMVETWVAKYHEEAAVAHFPGWRWTWALTALALVLYIGIILFRSPSSSDFIYFVF